MPANPSSKKLVKLFIINQFFHWFILGLTIPIISLYQIEKGLDLFQIGITGGFYAGTILLLELPTGALADEIGRKNVYLISQGLSFAATLVFLLADNFFLFIAAFVLMGISRSLSSGSMDAWFVDEFYLIDSKNNLQPALARVGFFIPISLCISTLLGGILPMYAGSFVFPYSEMNRYSVNFLLKLLLIIVHIGLTFKLIKEDTAKVTPNSFISSFKLIPKVIKTSFIFGIKQHIIFLVLLGGGVFGFVLSGIELFWQPHLKNILDSQFQPWMLGVISSGYFLFGSFGELLSPKICQILHSNYPLVLFINRLIQSVFLYFLAFQTGFVGFASLYFIFFMSNCISNSPEAAMINAIVPREKRSTLLSFQSLFIAVGGLIGSIILGYIAKEKSIFFAWQLSSLLLVVSAVFYLIIVIFNKRNNNK